MSGRQKRDAFAVIHFGVNPIYLELELYFFKMLRQYTRNDIVYLYSVNDTPAGFVDAVRPLVTEVVPYDDRGITYEVSFKSGYANFNTLRTCNFIFAYTLEKYNKVCIIESDMVIMKNIDAIFGLKAPAAVTYLVGDRNLKYNDRVKTVEQEVLEKCHDMGRINGGVMLIHPSVALFEEYKSKIVDVVQRECKYPNETLFEYVNREYYNLPIQYNLSHYLAKGQKLAEYRLSPSDIVVFHFNETKYKHIDIIKNPVDENGDNWLQIIKREKKYEVKKLPILHYKATVFDKYRAAVEPMMIEAVKKDASLKDASSKEASLKDASLSKEGSIKDDSLSKEGSIKDASMLKQDASLSKDASSKDASSKDASSKDASMLKDASLKDASMLKDASLKDASSKDASSKDASSKDASLPKDEIRKASPIASLSKDEIIEASPIASLSKDEIQPMSSVASLTPIATPIASPIASHIATTNASPIASITKDKTAKKPKKTKCPKGTRKNRRTGVCEPKGFSPTPSLSSSLVAEPMVAQQLAAKLLERNLLERNLSERNLSEEAPLQDAKNPKKCPKGTRKNRRTGICEPNK